ncbi:MULTISPECIES: hypothetical protein [Micrococcaceae]|jgi:hypothetical protein|uniref:Integral membrane protein n=3 Tax=Micrococcaceae TaxID=1268 RepID=Q6SK73_PAEAU|nr:MULTISPECIES: hypothetical protein [Micrococcaceae]AAS20099.1 hypothetical protein [Paenarthrobacter aurescens]ABM10450.1 Conserved hypothetical protein [Paenarthrobacter aurescens TC1]SDQ03309.1 hypothetical protein SAMN04489742_0062 [Arthrobacter crystallopoietes]
MVANDGLGVYTIIVAFTHIAFVAFLLGSALANIFRFPWFIYADDPKPTVQRLAGIAELVIAGALSLPYFWREGSVIMIAVALAYAGGIGLVSLWRWKRGHVFRPVHLLAPVMLALAFGTLKAGELALFAADVQA